MFANIKNGQLVKQAFVYQRRKKICETFLKILWKEGFIIGYTIPKENPKFIKIFLKYIDNKPVINNIKLITRPGKRVYLTTKQIWKMDSTKNLTIFSTSLGLKTIHECKKFQVGGELFIVIN